MTEIKQLKNFEDLCGELKNRSIPFRRVDGETALSIPTRLGEQNAILHIRWEPVPRVIQFIQVLPVTVPKERREALAILLNRINFTLPVPGFFMNEKQGVLTYRVQAFLGPDNAIASDTAGSLFDLTVRMAIQFLPQLQNSLASAEARRPKSLFDLTCLRFTKI